MTNDVLIVGAGQAGLASARAVARAGLHPVVLEASERVGGSWSSYYDSLTLFSPARFSELPGFRFGGDPDHYPHRDEVIAYLRAFADTLDAQVHTNTRVDHLKATGAPGGRSRFVAHTATGHTFEGVGLVAATGGFSRPYTPEVPGLGSFTGTAIHASDYQTPEPFAGQRVVVIGAGNSAVQVAVELAESAEVTLATREPLKFANPILLGRDLHWWMVTSGLDSLPIGRWLPRLPKQPVVDKDGNYSAAIAAGRPSRRPMFTAVEDDHLTWADGSTERVDALIFATGYRPALDFLAATGALDPEGAPRHRSGLSTTVPGLGYVGMEWQRSFSSATLRGVARDAAYVVRRLHSTWQANAPAISTPRAVRPASRDQPRTG